MTRIIADVYANGGRNIRIPTTPGRSVQFSGGHCIIVDNRDMPHMFAREDLKVFPRPDAMPWAPEWLGNTDWIKSEVHWPEGYAVEHRARDDYRIYGAEQDVSQAPSPSPGDPTQTAPVSPVDMTDRQESPPWLRPDDLLDSLLEDPADETPPTVIPQKKSRARGKRTNTD